MTDEMEQCRRRAAYRASHRGTKEMDFILGRYADAHVPNMTRRELDDFERFIATPDPVLTQWFSKGAIPQEPAFAALVTELRSFHGLAGSED
jgi:antitoxin CptB